MTEHELEEVKRNKILASEQPLLEEWEKFCEQIEQRYGLIKAQWVEW